MANNTSPMTQAENQPLPENITCEQLWAIENAGERPTIVDVREEKEWESGHIDWATHLPLGKIANEVEQILPNKNELVITCCQLGGRGDKAAKQLKAMGYTNVKNLSGGYTGYCEKDKETSTQS